MQMIFQSISITAQTLLLCIPGGTKTDLSGCAAELLQTVFQTDDLGL